MLEKEEESSSTADASRAINSLDFVDLSSALVTAKSYIYSNIDIGKVCIDRRASLLRT